MIPIKNNPVINSETISKLQPKLNQASQIIKQAIESHTPILIRHHCDCDGYCAALLLEKAIIRHQQTISQDPSLKYKLYTRSPSRAPYYDYQDALRDTTNFLTGIERFRNKAPLIIIVDNGSTEEDLQSIKLVKQFGAKVLVIDHHYPGEVTNGRSLIDDYVNLHINPYLVNSDSNFCTTILCLELANTMFPISKKYSHFAAMAILKDKCEGEEIKKYYDLAVQEGYREDFIKALSESIDYLAHYLKNLEARELISQILSEDKDLQLKITTSLYNEIQEKKERQLRTCLHYLKTEKINNTTIAKIQMDQILRMGEFPKQGQTAGIVFDNLKEKHDKLITLGINTDSITWRHNLDFNFNLILKKLKQQLPHANIDGGGHERAGTLTFIKAAKEEVLEALKKEFENVK
jgi:archaea-specific RecJ-like exonuclease